MNEMSHRERMKAVLEGQRYDRVPVSFWRHFYDQETSAEGLAAAMVGFQRRFDWDFMKINPRASYHVEGWGVKVRFSGKPLVKPEVLDVPVKTAEDWHRLKALRPYEGSLGEQLEAIRLIRREVGDDLPIIETVFSPLSIAGDLAGSDEDLRRSISEAPSAVHAALGVIARTFSSFAGACLDAGADGIFFATTSWASRRLLDPRQYAEFGRAYDLRVLDAVAEKSFFNVLHVCGSEIMLYDLIDYPVQAISWATDDPGNPTLGEVKGRTDKALIAGIDREGLLLSGSPEQVVDWAQKTRDEAAGAKLILGPSCSIPPEVPERNLDAIRSAAEAMKHGDGG